MKKQNFYGLFLLPAALLLLSGCFETEFQFDTRVESDGSVVRQTRIDGRGAHLFKAPEGAGWQSKVWQTEGEGALLPATYHHIQAKGIFSVNQEISPDYRFDSSRLGAEWQERNKERLEKAGIKPPYEEHVSTHNEIRIKQTQNWLAVTTVYEETFHNDGIIPLLLVDLKEEIRKQSVERGENFSEEELDQFARLRLEEEILPEIRFKSKVTLPGRVFSWTFSLKDFEENYSVYTLKAESRSMTHSAWIAAAAGSGAALLILGIIILILMKSKGRKEPKKKRSKKPSPAQGTPRPEEA